MEFEPKTYEEWADHHVKVMGPLIVKNILEDIKNEGKWAKKMLFFEIKKEKHES